MASSKTIVLLGCGKMGSALLRGWMHAGIEANFCIIEPGPVSFGNIQKFDSVSNAARILASADIIVLATKPQIADEICLSLRDKIPQDTLFLSIAAGKSLSQFSLLLGNTRPVIRSMPNTPASIAKGITVAISNQNVSAEQRSVAQTLLECVGECEWVADESLLDAVTALSGSGPAYVFLLIELMAKAGETLGLPSDLAMKLARQTVIGAGALAESEPEVSAETLRKNVTSPGGTTEAALKILMDGRMEKIFQEALAQAQKRGRALNS